MIEIEVETERKVKRYTVKKYKYFEFNTVHRQRQQLIKIIINSDYIIRLNMILLYCDDIVL